MSSKNTVFENDSSLLNKNSFSYVKCALLREWFYDGVSTALDWLKTELDYSFSNDSFGWSSQGESVKKRKSFLPLSQLPTWCKCFGYAFESAILKAYSWL